ncbi:MAG: methyltransferase domain-containing protein [Proteobacteria bacterium]|nr:methyltransferase domain-containing protein [Pseudomonadota bacterium]
MSSYAAITAHRQMHLDKVRNRAYARALAKIIGPETTVMDLGAGLGVHGLNAARMGAGKVYLVEPEAAIELARTVAAGNQLENVECLQQRVEDIVLDTPIDVMISVFTGNFLLTEDLLPSLFHARDKFLAQGGRLIPDRACMEVVPVSMPDYYKKHIDVWREYPAFCRENELPELDYTPARPFAANSLYYDSAESFNAVQLSQPADLKEIDFYTATSAACDEKLDVQITTAGECHGWLGWFRIRLGDEWLGTGPDDDATHWSQVFMPLEAPLKLAEGDTLTFHLKRPEFGEWTWATQHGEQRQRQSTFLSQPLSPQSVMKASEKYCPSLSQRGEAALWVLEQMKGQAPVAELASRLHARNSTLFAGEAEALEFVKKLTERYS